jgi:hypothetical protein
MLHILRMLRRTRNLPLQSRVGAMTPGSADLPRLRPAEPGQTERSPTGGGSVDLRDQLPTGAAAHGPPRCLVEPSRELRRQPDRAPLPDDGGVVSSSVGSSGASCPCMRWRLGGLTYDFFIFGFFFNPCQKNSTFCKYFSFKTSFKNFQKFLCNFLQNNPQMFLQFFSQLFV